VVCWHLRVCFERGTHDRASSSQDSSTSDSYIVQGAKYSMSSSWQMEYSEFVEALANGRLEVCGSFDGNSAIAKLLV